MAARLCVVGCVIPIDELLNRIRWDPECAKGAGLAVFYELPLPALGFTRRKNVEGWLEFEAEGERATEFFGITESKIHVVNENRIAFWAESPADVDRIAAVAARARSRNIEGPMDYAPGYYAVFFEDPCGNRLEACHRIGQ